MLMPDFSRRSYNDMLISEGHAVEYNGGKKDV